MEAPTLTICVRDEVVIREGSRPEAPKYPSPSPFFQPQFVFTISPDCTWAPARSRAPSVLIDFELAEAAF